MSQHEDFGFRKCIESARQHSHGFSFGHDLWLGIMAALVLAILSGLALHQEGWQTVAGVTVVGTVLATILVHITEFLWHLGRAPRRLRDEAFDRLYGRVTDLEGARLDAARIQVQVAQAKERAEAAAYAERWFRIESDGVLWSKRNPPGLQSFSWEEWMQMEALCPIHETFALKAVQIDAKGKEHEFYLSDGPVGIRADNPGTSIYPKCLAEGGHILQDVAEAWGGEKYQSLQKRAHNRWTAEQRRRKDLRVAELLSGDSDGRG